jgi:hypothetical protein
VSDEIYTKRSMPALNGIYRFAKIASLNISLRSDEKPSAISSLELDSQKLLWKFRVSINIYIASPNPLHLEGYKMG